MPRALVQRPLSGDRQAMLDTARSDRAAIRALDARCNFWLFERRADDGLVEFIEAPDEASLHAALRAITPQSFPVLFEVELS